MLGESLTLSLSGVPEQEERHIETHIKRTKAADQSTMASQGSAEGEHHPLASLRDWTGSRLSNLLKANTPETFDMAFDAFLAADAQITFNGAVLSREDYKQHMRNVSALGALAASATIHFEGEVEQQVEGQGEMVSEWERR